MLEEPSRVTPLLAVYGTLRQGYRNCSLIEGASTVISRGTLPGRLVHISSPLRRYPYPGYVPAADRETTDTPQQVTVELVRIDQAGLWPRLDALERYDPNDLDGSEYRRVLVVATTTAGKRMRCWTYRYDAPAEGYDVVPDGDWARLYPPEAAPR